MVLISGMITAQVISQSVTLSVSPLPSVDDVLDVLFDDYTPIDLPVKFFPTLPADSGVMVHPVVLTLFVQQGRQAMAALRAEVARRSNLATLIPRHIQNLLGVPAPVLTVHITGHGLGATVAQLVALALVNIWPDIVVTAFASPRVGNTAFAEWVNGSPITLRRVNSFADPVPHLPERFNGYQHAGSEIWIGADPSNVYRCEPTLERKVRTLTDI